MQRIHFSQYVLNDLRANGAKTAAVFMGGFVYINQDRMMDENDYYYVSNGKDDWRICVDYFFGYRTFHIVRGANDYVKVPNRQMKLALLAEYDKLEKARKERNRAAKLAEKQRKENAQWWP